MHGAQVSGTEYEEQATTIEHLLYPRGCFTWINPHGSPASLWSGLFPHSDTGTLRWRRLLRAAPHIHWAWSPGRARPGCPVPGTAQQTPAVKVRPWGWQDASSVLSSRSSQDLLSHCLPAPLLARPGQPVVFARRALKHQCPDAARRFPVAQRHPSRPQGQNPAHLGSLSPSQGSKHKRLARKEDGSGTSPGTPPRRLRPFL